MASSYHLGVIPTLLGRDRNVTFILDTSEAMATFLGTVKNLIIQTLLTKASLRDSLFNIITYSYKITALSAHMIPCAPDTVYESLGWIHTLRTSPGQDLHSALAAAFSDPACQSVHLLTTGVPDNPEKCLNALCAGTTRPVHTFHISVEQNVDTSVLDFLKCLTSATGGNCFRLSLNVDGGADQITLVHSAERQMKDPWHSVDMGHHAVTCQSMQTRCFSPCRCSVNNPFAVSPCLLARVSRGAEFFPGCRVLARRELDGFYYMGTIMQQLQDRRGLFMVSFESTPNQGSTGMTSVQATCQPDMVNLTQAHGHTLVPGDTVLAPWEFQVSRYGPGRIISGMERRDPLMGGEGCGIVVLFWNGLQIHVPKNLAVWISASQHEQIIQDLHARRLTAGCPRDHCCGHFNCSPSYNMNHSFCMTCPRCHCSVNGQTFNLPLLMRDAGVQEVVKCEELKKLYTPNEDIALSSSEDEEEAGNGRVSSTGLELMSRSVNTEISCLRKASSVSAPPSRPAWRYWTRKSAEPHHKKPGRVMERPAAADSWSGKLSDSGYSSCSSTMTNHSSVFETVPSAVKRGVTVGEVFNVGETKSPIKAASPLLSALNQLSSQPTS